MNKELEARRELAPLHQLQFETAAEHYTNRVPIASAADEVQEVCRQLIGKPFDSVSEIVVCDSHGHLQGLVNVEELLAASPTTCLGQIMDQAPPTVSPGLDQELAAWTAIHHHESSLAVVDDQHVFQGIITPQRIFEVLLWEHDEDTARLGGFLRTSAVAYSSSTEPLMRRMVHRLPWLLIGLVGAIVSADLIGAFEAQLQANVILAFFIPGVVYLADAVGTQTETLVIRGLSVGVSIREVFVRECFTGLLIGALLATALFPLLLLRWQRTEVALAVSIALFAACSIASFLAMALPAILHYLGRDPAFAAGPLATVIQDILSVALYFIVCFAIVGSSR